MGGMNRRHFTLLLPTVGLLAGCDIDQEPSHSATLLNNEGVQEALKALEDAIDTLEGDVGRFEGENWRDVVPDVEAAATDIRDAFDRLRNELGVQNP